MAKYLFIPDIRPNPKKPQSRVSLDDLPVDSGELCEVLRYGGAVGSIKVVSYPLAIEIDSGNKRFDTAPVLNALAEHGCGAFIGRIPGEYRPSLVGYLSLLFNSLSISPWEL